MLFSGLTYRKCTWIPPKAASIHCPNEEHVKTLPEDRSACCSSEVGARLLRPALFPRQLSRLHKSARVTLVSISSILCRNVRLLHCTASRGQSWNWCGLGPGFGSVEQLCTVMSADPSVSVTAGDPDWGFSAG